MPKSTQISQRSDICRHAIRELPEKIRYWEVYCSAKKKFVFKSACGICPRFETFPEQCSSDKYCAHNLGSMKRLAEGKRG